MTRHSFSRRTVLPEAAAGAVALLVSPDEWLAYQGNRERAPRQLQGALRSLREAKPDSSNRRSAKRRPASTTPQAISAIEES